ncbi:MAG: PIN domain-containing protein [Gammaproteobacteria bacterium]|nr:PIN domain-containing protein [Gammaproteobacteria bacterium]
MAIKKYSTPLDMIIIQIHTTQENNLDFHLAYYLGKYDQEANKNITFEVISNDKGYSPL